jgi:elongator complex protein 3
LKDAGFKLGYHVMPGLPYSTKERDLELFGKIFSDQAYKPDQLKIYPCQVIDDSPLAKTYEQIGFKPMNEDETREILEEMTKMIPEYCRTMRIMREIPPDLLIAGTTRIDIRRDVEKNLRDEKVKVNEIRMRELGFNKQFYKKMDDNVSLKTTKYDSSGGKEFFLQFVNKDNILFGLLSLRFLNKPFMNELIDAGTGSKDSAGPIAMVREIHVYGQALNLGDKGNEGQHIGMGKKLMAEAEKISRENGYKRLAVISGVGVREYYRKLGYSLEGPYMIKKL